jgi:protein-S-isoprenylcysteine O-methyltransferase Ste14
MPWRTWAQPLMGDTMGEVQGQGDEPPRLNRRRIIRSLLCLPLFCYLCLFLPAGTFGWVRGWGFIAIFLLTNTLILVYLWRTNPALLIARSSFHRGTKRWDTRLLAILFPMLIAIFPIAALDDGRFHWSAMPWWLSGIGYVGMLGGLWLVTWACRVNKFAEPTVRIQHDRGHTVVETGPYAVIRHPMYSASLVLFPGMALALGSYWALVPASVASGILILRTQWEDQTLQAELDGYREYTHWVPYKLIPHVW